MKPIEPEFLPRDAAATYLRSRYGLRCSKQYLAKLAVVGGGPLFRKAGRGVLYSPDDLDSWAKSLIGPPQTSTSTSTT